MCVIVKYSDEKMQAIHDYKTKSASDAAADLCQGLTTKQWFTIKSDPFGRAPLTVGF